MIVVTAPTGQIGSQLVERLVAARQTVRVVVRDPARLPEKIRGKLDIVEGSHGDAAVMDEACKGADAVFWLVPPDPQAKGLMEAYVEFSRPACEAFARQGIEHVVGVSSLGRGKPQALYAGLITASLTMDNLIASTGVNYRALTMPSFMENLLRQKEQIKQGFFYSPVSGDLRMPTCSTRDVAAAAAELLLDRAWSGTGEQPVLGPEELSFNQMAKVMSEVLDKPVQFLEISSDSMKAGLCSLGQSEAMAQGVVDMWSAIRDGIYSHEARSSETMLTTAFPDWCKEVLAPALQSWSVGAQPDFNRPLLISEA